MKFTLNLREPYEVDRKFDLILAQIKELMTREHGNQVEIETTPMQSETVSELVRRHLHDPLHQTTEEELRNAILDTAVVGTDELSTRSNSRKNS